MLDYVSLSLKSRHIHFLSQQQKSRALCFPLARTHTQNLRSSVFQQGLAQDNMQRGREGGDDFFRSGESGDLLGSFGGFGGDRRSHRSMMPSIFGERDPCDHPYFTRPFGSLFDSGSGMFGSSAATSKKDQTSRATGIVMEELTSDGEGLNEEDEGTGVEKDNHQNHSRPCKEPSVEHPDDDTDETKSKILVYGNDGNKVEVKHSHASRVSVQTCRVTYGGVNGDYYTSTRTTRAGTDGVVLEETKEADRTTGQAKHRISIGIHDKGHSVTRKLNSDGKMDTLQTLHNLNEDELAGFEEAWKGNAKGNLPGREDGFHMHGNAGPSSSKQETAGWGGCALPSGQQLWKAGGMKPDNDARNNFSAGRTKKVVRINIE
ncbi:hypothetical protein FH972_001738 [Carpinus fangiana]|uniref:Myeloid leukemia factor n=1 Tax=Carpinus fangiana TaxID=176857 RepID=A0A5N6QF32_9ROSI|nr:hypothetical protein FH972_001738 [Carpinus fangiana]